MKKTNNSKLPFIFGNWIVKEDGIQHLKKDYYHFDKTRLIKEKDWMEYIASKGIFSKKDVNSFNVAFLLALISYNAPIPFPHEIANSFNIQRDFLEIREKTKDKEPIVLPKEPTSSIKKKKYLFFDTETTGLNKNARLVQIAWILCDHNQNEIEKQCFIIKPDNFLIPKESIQIHGISNEDAQTSGFNLKDVLEKFNTSISKTDYIIAHNLSFDEEIIKNEFKKTAINLNLKNKKRICTKIMTTQLCAIPSIKHTFKWPTLSELHIKLFNEDLNDAHSALSDTLALMKCYWELEKYGLSPRNHLDI